MDRLAISPGPTGLVCRDLTQGSILKNLMILSWLTMIISVVDTWLVTILLAYLLPKYTNLGVLGVRWAMAASVVVGGIAMIIYLRTGRWKTRRV